MNRTITSVHTKDVLDGFPLVGRRLWFHKLSNYQTRQRWSNVNQDSVTALPILHVKYFQKHTLVYCLAVTLKCLWPGRHVENGRAKLKHRPTCSTSLSVQFSARAWLFRVCSFCVPQGQGLGPTTCFHQTTSISICLSKYMFLMHYVTLEQ